MWMGLLSNDGVGRVLSGYRDPIYNTLADFVGSWNETFLLTESIQMFPLVTEISPIFGLSLLGLVEHAVIWALIVSIVTLIVVGYDNHRRHKLQVKSTSAQLALKLLEVWEGNNTFTKMIRKLEKAHAEFTDKDDRVHFVLTKFEDIAILKRDKLLTETHVQEFFGRDIVRIAANKSVMRILNEYHNEDTRHNYNNLKNLLKTLKNGGCILIHRWSHLQMRLEMGRHQHVVFLPPV